MMEISNSAVVNKLMEIASTIGSMSVTLLSLERRVGSLEEKIDRRFRSDPPRSWTKTDTGSHYLVKADEAEQVLFNRFEEKRAAGWWNRQVAGIRHIGLAVAAGGLSAAVITWVTLWWGRSH